MFEKRAFTRTPEAGIDMMETRIAVSGANVSSDDEKPVLIPGGVTVAQEILVLFVQVRILAG
jgi:hypothetical protein